MKFNLKYSILLLMLAVSFLLSGGYSNASINLQLTPDAPEEKEVKNVKVSYIVPDNIIRNKSVEETLHFKGFHSGSSNRQEKLWLKQGTNLWKIERRTDNGVAGSGRAYDVKVSKQKVGNNVKISFIVKKEHTYQEGVILPFAVPDFDIKGYLVGASIDYSFELNSKYDVESVKANFDRLLQKSNGKYLLETEGALFANHVKFYPYRGGTKVVINSEVYGMRGHGNVINFDVITNELKKEMTKVVEA